MTSYRTAILLSVTSCLLSAGCGKGGAISTSDEVKLGKKCAADIESQMSVTSTSVDAVRLKRIGDRLALHCEPRPGMTFTFRVIESDEVNVVSYPGGPIYVYRGLLRLIGDDDDMLAVVLGHSIGHVLARHVILHIGKQLELSAVLSLVLNSRGETLGQTNGPGMRLLGYHFSNADELDADERGMSYAYKAGFDPRGVIRFAELTRIRKQQLDMPMLRNHPESDARVSRASRIIEAKEYRYGQ